jgi:UDP-glucose 4-epimerase
MNKVLITGGCGFIGSNLVKYLLDKTNWEIHVLDNLSKGKLEHLIDLDDFESRVSFFKGDIVNIEDIYQAIKGCRYAINLAAQTGVIESIKDPFMDEKINIFGTINLLKASIDNKVEKFIQASSAAAVGKQKMPLNESQFPKPISPYGASKLASECYCRVFSNLFKLKTVVLRFSNVYGPKSYKKSSVIPKFIKHILKNKNLVVYGNGNQTRDFIYVEDVCLGIYLSLIKNLETFELVQLGTGKETSINSLINIFKDLIRSYDIKLPVIINSNPRTGELLKNYSDITKAKELLGFSIKRDLKEGLNETFKWYFENHNHFTLE